MRILLINESKAIKIAFENQPDFYRRILRSGGLYKDKPGLDIIYV